MPPFNDGAGPDGSSKRKDGSAHARCSRSPTSEDEAGSKLERARKKMRKAKRKGRPELKTEDWFRRNYRKQKHHWKLGNTGGEDRMTRVDYDACDEAEFIERFEKTQKPCVIRGSFARCGAMAEWTLKKLKGRFGNEKFKVGEDDDGYKVMIKLKYYLRYLDDDAEGAGRDDSPLYAFDSSFGDHAVKKHLCDDYEVPKYFRDDLFKLAGESRRPPYRWFIVGPPRSGTGIHIDPLGTSAWNALIQGHKRWVVFPPHVPKAALRPRSGLDSEAITWFAEVYPITKRPDWPHTPPTEFIQGPGEVVFIPGGWHHVVLNMDTTIAVTQNFCSKTNFRLVWPRTARGRPKLSKKLYNQLKIHHPELAVQADTISLTAKDELPSDSSSDSSSSSSSSSSSEDDSVPEPPKKKKKTKKAGFPSQGSERSR